MTSECSVGGESGPFANTEATVTLLFFFFALASGIVARQLLFIQKVFPYTALQFILGLLFGVWNFAPDDDQLGTLGDSIDIWSDIDGELILFAFLPNLVFSDAYNVNVHVFWRAFPQTLLLAAPGVALGALLTAVFAKEVLSFDWSWNVAMVFGSILSATDPVAVVALLKDLGASPILSTIIAGEALLNDGTAVVFFELFAVIAFFARNVLGAPAIGAAFAIPIVRWFQYTSDPIIQVALTFVGANLSYFVSQFEADASGVLAVVTFGVILSAWGKPAVTGEAAKFMEIFWENIEWIANTVIFFLAGAITADVAISRLNVRNDILYLFLLYVIVYVIRLVVLVFFYPVLRCVGYGMSTSEVVLIGHGGLRGAVGLALALSFAETSEFTDEETRERILFFVAGIAFLTLIVNGPTTSFVSSKLGLTKETAAQRDVVKEARGFINHTLLRKFIPLRKDKLLGKADIEVVVDALKLHKAQSEQDKMNSEDQSQVQDSRHDHRDQLSSRAKNMEEKKWQGSGIDSGQGYSAYATLKNDYSRKLDKEFRAVISQDKEPRAEEPSTEEQGAEEPSDEESEDEELGAEDMNHDASNLAEKNLMDTNLPEGFTKDVRKDLRSRFFTQLRREYWELLEKGYIIGQTAALLVDSVDVAFDLLDDRENLSDSDSLGDSKRSGNSKKLGRSNRLGDWDHLEYYCRTPADMNSTNEAKYCQNVSRGLKWLLGWFLGWRHGADLGLSMIICWSYIKSHQKVREKFEKLFEDDQGQDTETNDQSSEEKVKDAVGGDSQSQSYSAQTTLIAVENKVNELQKSLTVKNSEQKSHLKIIRRELVSIKKQSEKEEKLARRIFQKIDKARKGIKSNIKNYQTIRVLLNEKVHLIEELRMEGMLTEQETAVLLQEAYSERLSNLRKELREGYNLGSIKSKSDRSKDESKSSQPTDKPVVSNEGHGGNEGGQPSLQELQKTMEQAGESGVHTEEGGSNIQDAEAIERIQELVKPTEESGNKYFSKKESEIFRQSTNDLSGLVPSAKADDQDDASGENS